MKKNLVLFIALFTLSFFVNAQSDSTGRKKDEDKPQMQTLLGGKSSFGAFGALDIKFSEANRKSALVAGVRGGVVLNHRLSLGVAAYGLTTATRWQGTTSINDQNLFGGYGGLFAEYTILPLKAIHLSVPVVIGVGGVAVGQGTGNDWDMYDTIESSSFFVAEPGLMLEFNVTKFFRFGIGGSYRYVSGAYLPDTGISNAELSNVAGNVSFKFGKF